VTFFIPLVWNNSSIEIEDDYNLELSTFAAVKSGELMHSVPSNAPTQIEKCHSSAIVVTLYLLD